MKSDVVGETVAGVAVGGTSVDLPQQGSGGSGQVLHTLKALPLAVQKR